MAGYSGKILDIDLASGKVDVRQLPMEMAAKFIGGTGFGSKIVSDQVGLDADPLGAENIIVFAPGPLNGTGAPFSGRLEVVAKSPLTGLLGLANSGGGCGVELKRAGYDALVVRNVSPKPVYIWINNDQVEVRDTSDLWGKDVFQTTDLLKKALAGSSAKEVKVMAIGPAGENLVRFAAILEEYYHAAARCGLGAVMGSKKLKAVAVRGTKRVEVAHPEAFRQAVKEALDRANNGWHPAAKASIEQRKRYASMPSARSSYEGGMLSGKNYQASRLPGWLENNTLEAAKKYITREFASCPACPWRCFHLGEVNDGKYAGLKIASATFVAVISEIGAKCAITSIPAIWKAKESCHKLGLDEFSFASTTAFAMELYQRGIITRQDTGGIDLTWGNDDATLEMLEHIAYRRGLGDVLAEGCQRAAQKIGRGAQKYAMTMKGLELTGSDPRSAAKNWSTGYLANPRGGDNVRVAHTQLGAMPRSQVVRETFGMTAEEYCQKYVASLDIFEEEKKQIFGVPPRLDERSYEGKAAFTKWMGDVSTVLNSLVLCIFGTTVLHSILGPTTYSRLYSAATGIELSPRELMKAGERISNLQRMYGVGRGISSKDDDWPARFYEEGVSDGPYKGTRLQRQDVAALMQEYYQLRGWDKQGKPTKKKLEELGLL